MSKPIACLLTLLMAFLVACGGTPATPTQSAATGTVAPATTGGSEGDASPTALSTPVQTATPATATDGTVTVAATASPAPTGTAAAVPTETAPPASAGFPLTYTDTSGTRVTLQERPERIISLFASNNDTLFTIGAGDQVVAVDDFTNWPEEAAEKPKVGGNNFKFNVEQMVSLKPDLVLTSFGVEELVDKPLRKAGIKVIATPFSQSVDDVYKLMRDLGRISGHREEAEREVTKLQATIKDVQNRTASAKKTRVYFETDASNPGKPYTTSPGSLIDRLITLAGGQNVFSKIDVANPQVSYEAIVDADPEVLLLADVEGNVPPNFLNPTTVAEVKQRAGFNKIKAVRDNRVVPIHPDLTNPGPRLAEGLRALAVAIHPEIFGEK